VTGLTDKFLLSLALVAVGVGILDASFGREWDLLVVFALVGVIMLVLWLRQGAERMPVTLRADLAQWVRERSHRTGEPFEDFLDRSVARSRHRLYSSDDELQPMS